jgi:radical SAM/Cys-rich protein
MPHHQTNPKPPPSDFIDRLQTHGLTPLQRKTTRTVQINVGKLCNQACHHCHVEAGPKRTEIMTAATAARIIELLAVSPGIESVDLTGGAPELNAQFKPLVEATRKLGKRVIVRCNLTVLFEENMEWLPAFYTRNQVELVCSLPCYTAETVDGQRGNGVFDKSIRGLQLLGKLGFGQAGSGLTLDLVYNPTGAALPPPQAELEARYREELERLFGIRFNHLFTITNMPIKRFAEMLNRSGEHDAYMALLANHFNPSTVENLMCRDLISVGWEGSLYDCDFNQMLEIPLNAGPKSKPLRLEDLETFHDIEALPITTASHCFGCTAGSGSSCGGSLAD